MSSEVEIAQNSVFGGSWSITLDWHSERDAYNLFWFPAKVGTTESLSCLGSLLINFQS